jgi:hypothetical protein
LSNENTHLKLQVQSLLSKHEEEVRQLKEKISDLQNSIDHINSYILTKEKEFMEETKGPDGGKNNLILMSPTEDQRENIDSFHQRSLSRKQTSPYVYDNYSGNFVNNFNSYYDMSSFYSSPSSQRSNSRSDDEGDDHNNLTYIDSPSMSSMNLRRGIAAGRGDLVRSMSAMTDHSAVDEAAEERKRNNDHHHHHHHGTDPGDVVSNTTLNRSPSKRGDFIEKIRTFNEYYNSPEGLPITSPNKVRHHPPLPPSSHDQREQDKFFADIPTVSIDESFSLSLDQHHNVPSLVPSNGKKGFLSKSTPNSKTNTPSTNSMKVKFQTASASSASPEGNDIHLSTSQSPLNGNTIENRPRRFSDEEGNDIPVTTTTSMSPFGYLHSHPGSYLTLLNSSSLDGGEGGIYVSPLLLNDSRIQQHFQESEESFKQHYEALSYGLTLSTITTDLLYQQFKEIRTMLSIQSENKQQQTYQLEYSLEDFKINNENLYEKNEQLIQSLYYSKEKLSSTELLLTEYEEKYFTLLKDFNAFKNNLKLKENQICLLEDHNLQEKLKNEKLALELTQLNDKMSTMRISNLQFENKIDLLNDKYKDLEVILDSLKEEKEILFIEREELMKRFLPSLARTTHQGDKNNKNNMGGSSSTTTTTQLILNTSVDGNRINQRSAVPSPSVADLSNSLLSRNSSNPQATSNSSFSGNGFSRPLELSSSLRNSVNSTTNDYRQTTPLSQQGFNPTASLTNTLPMSSMTSLLSSSASVPSPYHHSSVRPMGKSVSPVRLSSGSQNKYSSYLLQSSSNSNNNNNNNPITSGNNSLMSAHPYPFSPTASSSASAAVPSVYSSARK